MQVIVGVMKPTAIAAHLNDAIWLVSCYRPPKLLTGAITCPVPSTPAPSGLVPDTAVSCRSGVLRSRGVQDRKRAGGPTTPREADGDRQAA